MDRDEDRDGKLWSHSVGEPCVDRVRVYERPDLHSLAADWREDGKRHRRSLEKIVGRPITDREEAVQIAEHMASKLRKREPIRIMGTLERWARKRSTYLHDLYAMDDSELLGDRVPAGAFCGIYFLLRAGRVVYVGRSVSAFQRIASHRNDPPFPWDEVAFQPVPKVYLDRAEAYFIDRFTPPGNTHRPAVDERDAWIGAA